MLTAFQSFQVLSYHNGDPVVEVLRVELKQLLTKAKLQRWVTWKVNLLLEKDKLDLFFFSRARLDDLGFLVEGIRLVATELTELKFFQEH